MELGMLYMVRKIFLQGISFNIVYNEPVHENVKIKNNKFTTELNKIYQSFLNRDGCV